MLLKIRHLVGFENEWYAAAPFKVAAGSYRPHGMRCRRPLLLTVEKIPPSGIFSTPETWPCSAADYQTHATHKGSFLTFLVRSPMRGMDLSLSQLTGAILLPNIFC
jgi:hypothetical protein